MRYLSLTLGVLCLCAPCGGAGEASVSKPVPLVCRVGDWMEWRVQMARTAAEAPPMPSEKKEAAEKESRTPKPAVTQGKKPEAEKKGEAEAVPRAQSGKTAGTDAAKMPVGNAATAGTSESAVHVRLTVTALTEDLITVRLETPFGQSVASLPRQELTPQSLLAPASPPTGMATVSKRTIQVRLGERRLEAQAEVVSAGDTEGAVRFERWVSAAVPWRLLVVRHEGFSMEAVGFGSGSPPAYPLTNEPVREVVPRAQAKKQPGAE